MNGLPSNPVFPGVSRHAKYGGRIRRRHTRTVRLSLLQDREDSSMPMPRVVRAGLRFGAADPFEVVLAALARAGLDDPELLRGRHATPPTPLLLHVEPEAPWALDVSRATDEAVLREALLLGLCNRWHYDPARPVIWTRAALTRCVELHAPGDFYA